MRNLMQLGKEKDWEDVRGVGTGGWNRFRKDCIYVAFTRNRKTKKERVRIGLPVAILDTAGLRYRDKVGIKFRDGLCQIIKIDDDGLGYHVTGRAGERGMVGFPMTERIEEVFFPNAKIPYSTMKFEIKKHVIQFGIGDNTGDIPDE